MGKLVIQGNLDLKSKFLVAVSKTFFVKELIKRRKVKCDLDSLDAVLSLVVESRNPILFLTLELIILFPGEG